MTTGPLNRLVMAGEFTIFTAAEWRRQLLEALDAGLEAEVDLSQVGEIDSAGLQLMVAAKREAAQRGQRLDFIGHSPAVVELLELCRLESHLGDPLLIPTRT